MNKPTVRRVPAGPVLLDADRDRVGRMTLEELLTEALDLGVAPSVVIRKLDPPRRTATRGGTPNTLAGGM